MKRERGIVLAIKHGLNNDLGLAFCPRGIQNVQTLGLHDLVNHSASIVKKGFLGGSEVRVRSKDLLIRSHGFRGGCVGDQLGGHVGAWVGSSLVLSPGVGHGGGVLVSRKDEDVDEEKRICEKDVCINRSLPHVPHITIPFPNPEHCGLFPRMVVLNWDAEQ